MVERAHSRLSGDGALEDFAARARTVARQSVVDAAAVEAFDRLAAANIDAVVLKGLALARVLYGSGEYRGYFDVDLLVAPSDLAAAGAVLIDMGYANLTERRGIDDVAGIAHAETWSRWEPGWGSLVVDLHWRLNGCQAAPEVAWNALRARRASIDLDGRRLPTLDQPALALHLALHTAQHGPSDVKAVGDLNRGLERWPGGVWRQAAELADELRATDAFAAGLRLIPAGAALARELELPSADALQWSIAHRDERPRGTFHMKAFAEADGLRERMRVLRRSLLPARAWIIWEHPWAAAGRGRLIAGYGLHVLRSPAWAVRAWRFSRRARRDVG